MDMERYTFELRAEESNRQRVRGRFTPYNVPDGRSGIGFRVDESGEDFQIVRYESSVFEPGVFSTWLSENGDRVRFLFQHGDAGDSMYGVPMGVNALPLGRIDSITEEEDGAYYEATFASHPLAAAVAELAEMGALKEMSFAMRPVSAEIRDSEDGHVYRHVTAAELMDVSVVVNGQFGSNAQIEEVFTRFPELRAGAAISKANAETLGNAVSDIRSAVSTLADHADAIEALVASGVRDQSDDEDNNEDADDTEERVRERIAGMENRARALRIR